MLFDPCCLLFFSCWQSWLRVCSNNNNSYSFPPTLTTPMWNRTLTIRRKVYDCKRVRRWRRPRWHFQETNWVPLGPLSLFEPTTVVLLTGSLLMLSPCLRQRRPAKDQPACCSGWTTSEEEVCGHSPLAAGRERSCVSKLRGRRTFLGTSSASFVGFSSEFRVKDCRPEWPEASVQSPG